ncbi:hypothetical protein [Aquitalea sp. LB_tupeE]|uniref:hypothetical protein n=1 Tax=Aquitalea sp. LB_tupeE TaxID=2748078 RepID=UPI0015BF78DD|nr:hypothetical protein [Aquitalea sp. LB_tupeE]NWK76479.1 hypothetical protein [Aquitalea sp. LB_tupeE]
MRAILILGTLLLAGCSSWLQSSKDLLQSWSATARPHTPNEVSGLCQVRYFLIGGGREYPEAKGSVFVSSYSISTDQGQLHVDDATVYRDIMQAKGQRVALLMSNAAGGWIVDLAADSQRKLMRSSVMCRLPSQNEAAGTAP